MASEQIDICLTKTGKLVFLAPGTSDADELTVSIFDRRVEISGDEVIAEAEAPEGVDVAAMVAGRNSAFVVLMDGANEKMFGAMIVRQEM